LSFACRSPVCTGAVSLQFSRFQGHGFSSRQSEVIKLNAFPFVSKFKQKRCDIRAQKKKRSIQSET
jgi:hypothetical protein